MLTLDSPKFKELIVVSAALRGKGAFADAVKLIESELPNMAEECYLNAYMEILYASKESSHLLNCRKYARKLAAIDPSIPSIQEFL